MASWFHNCVDQLPLAARPTEIVCLGIGNFSHQLTSLNQLGFLLTLKSKLNVSNVTFHEPILSKCEIEVLQQLGLTVCPDNLEGRVSLPESALVYLPHCPKQLTNNLLFANWSSDRLRNVSLIGNSFDELIQSTPRRFLEQDAHFILRIKPFVAETQFGSEFSHVFNFTSLHTFTPELPAAEAAFWQHKEQPVYADDCLELITRVTELTLK